jgi:hypothetical protein
MKALQHLSLAVALALLGAGFTQAESRQEYTTKWEQHKSGGYYYIDYQFKPDPEQKEHNLFYVCFYPSRPGHLYYYDPAHDVYWGRYNLKTRHFEVLDESPRNRRLADIPESAFRERDRVIIPRAKDTDNKDAIMEPPPADTLPGKPAADKYTKPGP